MARTVMAFVAGFLVAAALAWAGQAQQPKSDPPLSSWKGEGARPGLYHETWNLTKPGVVSFWECRPIGEGKVIAPPR